MRAVRCSDSPRPPCSCNFLAGLQPCLALHRKALRAVTMQRGEVPSGRGSSKLHSATAAVPKQSRAVRTRQDSRQRTTGRTGSARLDMDRRLRHGMPCNIPAHALQHPCACLATSLRMPCNIPAHALQHPCARLATSLRTPCNIPAHALQHPCARLATSLRTPCDATIAQARRKPL